MTSTAVTQYSPGGSDATVNRPVWLLRVALTYGDPGNQRSRSTAMTMIQQSAVARPLSSTALPVRLAAVFVSTSDTSSRESVGVVNVTGSSAALIEPMNADLSHHPDGADARAIRTAPANPLISNVEVRASTAAAATWMEPVLAFMRAGSAVNARTENPGSRVSSSELVPSGTIGPRSVAVGELRRVIGPMSARSMAICSTADSEGRIRDRVSGSMVGLGRSIRRPDLASASLSATSLAA